MVRLSEADRELLDLAWKRAKERQIMSKRTIDETGRDVPQQRGRQVVEVLYLRPDPDMDRLTAWVLKGCVVPDDWFRTEYTRVRIILDNES